MADAKKDWLSSDARAALYVAVVEGQIPLQPAANENDDKLWECFNVQPEVHNYGEFENHFKCRLAGIRKAITKNISQAKEDQKAFDILCRTIPRQQLWQMVTIQNGRDMKLKSY